MAAVKTILVNFTVGKEYTVMKVEGDRKRSLEMETKQLPAEYN